MAKILSDQPRSARFNWIFCPSLRFLFQNNSTRLPQVNKTYKQNVTEFQSIVIVVTVLFKIALLKRFILGGANDRRKKPENGYYMPFTTVFDSYFFHQFQSQIW